MRLRKSNQTKRFRTSDFALGLDSSDEDPAVGAPKDDDSEEEFVVEEPHVDAVESDDSVEGDEEPDDNGSDEVYNNSDMKNGDSYVVELAVGEEQRLPSLKKKQDPSIVTKRESLGHVSAYPTDPGQKWTRTYIGPLKRWTRFIELADYWFGDRPDFASIANGCVKLWWEHMLIPPKLRSKAQLRKAQSGWMSTNFAEDQEARFSQWYERYLSLRTTAQISSPIDRATAFRWFLPKTQHSMTVLLGHVSAQNKYSFHQGESIPFADNGEPMEETDSERLKCGGWLLDIGGIVLAMGWAPVKGEAEQLLAMAVIPFSDQAFYQNLDDGPKNSGKKEGAIQIWGFGSVKGSDGVPRPTRRDPRLAHAMCFQWGRVVRMQWCPFSFTPKDRCGLLAILSGDGKVRILEVRDTSVQGDTGIFEEVEEPMLTLEPPSEHTIEITCFAWINVNRIAAGLSDGSVVVYSISPYQILQRHPVHTSSIMDIASGYPSDPFIIATLPMAGLVTVTDLNRPNAEVSYHPSLLIALQPNMLAWSPHLRGFATVWPTPYPGNKTLCFVQARTFSHSRHICTVGGLPTCVAVGSCHPFVLIGASDGSLTVFNLLRKVVSTRNKCSKLLLFQHEYRTPVKTNRTANGDNDETDEPPRGICRILHGFLPEVNSHPYAAKSATKQMKKRQLKKTRPKKNNSKAKGKGKKPGGANQEEEDAEDLTRDGDATGEVPVLRGPIIIHEPLTRITCAAWNPNAEFSWWAAAATGSGLVRVMDLGSEAYNGSDDNVSTDGDEDDGGLDQEEEALGADDLMDEVDEFEDEEDDIDMASWAD